MFYSWIFLVSSFASKFELCTIQNIEEIDSGVLAVKKRVEFQNLKRFGLKPESWSNKLESVHLELKEVSTECHKSTFCHALHEAKSVFDERLMDELNDQKKRILLNLLFLRQRELEPIATAKDRIDQFLASC